MCLNGVHLDGSGNPVRWKVQNSYGESMGIKGHYVMADDWFDQYVTTADLLKQHLPEHVLRYLDREPKPLF